MASHLQLNAHTLGPHVVGQRVVIRRLIPGEVGPTGGPAFRDLLGICLAWNEDDIVVEHHDGTRVSIPIKLIVSGKPVPPRPSVRHRASAAEAQTRLLPLFDPTQVEPLGAWKLRGDLRPELTAHLGAEPASVAALAHTCLAMGEPGIPLAAAAAGIIAHYTRFGLPARAQVRAGSDADLFLREEEWVEQSQARSGVWLGSVSKARRELRQAKISPSYLDDIVGTEPPNPEPDDSLDHLGQLGAAITDEGQIVASYAQDWLGIVTLEVFPAASAPTEVQLRLIAGALAWGAERGASTVWIPDPTITQAMGEVAMWAELDLAHHHRYSVLQAPPQPAGS